jgi:hypothetical protein
MALTKDNVRLAAGRLHQTERTRQYGIGTPCYGPDASVRCYFV